MAAEPVARDIYCCPSFFYFIYPTSVYPCREQYVCIYILISDTVQAAYALPLLELVRNLVAHGDAREGK